MTDVLVLYVDPFGPTAQVAMQVAEQLCRRGLRVELRKVGRATPGQGTPVVLGGATGPRTWDPAALEYLRSTDDPSTVHAFHTDFGTGAGEVPEELLAWARAHGVSPVPVLPDVELDQVPARRGRCLGRSTSPALQWADALADQLRSSREELALVG